MHKPIIYKNNRNEENVFGTRELFINNMDLFDYSWTYDTDFGRVDNFRKDTQEKELTISIYGSTKAEVNNRKNAVFEIFEKDVLANRPGKLWIGDYYLSCYVVESSISAYHRQGNYLAKEIKIVTDAPLWIREISNIFYKQGMTELPDLTSNLFQRFSLSPIINYHFSAPEGSKAYPYGYSYGYSNNLTIQSITNNHFIGSNFELIIYGPVVNPTVFIKGYPYTIYTELYDGEYLTINSKNKTVIKTKINGEQVNEFNRRNKEYSVFKLIGPGQNSVSWNEEFTFGLILLDERSEPLWT